MRIDQEQTIFSKMGISYDDLRNMENPIAPVAKYYRSQLKPGESLWWTGDSSDETVSATIRLWKNVKADQKRFYTVYGCVNYPEIFAGNYDRYALWLTSQGVVDSHIRDQFSVGGQEEMLLSTGERVKFPGVYRRVKSNSELFVRHMAQNNTAVLIERASLDINSMNQRLLAWADAVSRCSTVDYDLSMDALKTFFWGQNRVADNLKEK